MRRTIPVLLSVVFLAAGCVIVVPPTEPVGMDEEYRVYAGLIEGMFMGEGVEQIVIREQTSGFDVDGAAERLAGIQAERPDLLTDEMIDDYIAKNASAYTLTHDLPLDILYTLISEAEVQDFFKDTSGWDRFYEKYPDAQGMMLLSRVGFSQDGTRALVYVGNQQHWLAGAGHYVLLTRTADGWTVAYETMVWIS